jgi:hypothetical protein
MMPLFMAMPMPFGEPDNRQPETVALAKGGQFLAEQPSLHKPSIPQ